MTSISFHNPWLILETPTSKNESLQAVIRMFRALLSYSGFPTYSLIWFGPSITQLRVLVRAQVSKSTKEPKCNTVL